MNKSISTALYIDDGFSLEVVLPYIKCDDFQFVINNFDNIIEYNINVTKKNYQLYLLFSSNLNSIYEFLKLIDNDKNVLAIVITKGSSQHYSELVKAGADDVVDLQSIHILPSTLFRELHRYSGRIIHNYLKYSNFKEVKSVSNQKSNTICKCKKSDDDFSLLRCVLDNLDNHLIFIKDANSRKFIYANYAYCNALQLGCDKIIGKLSDDILPNDLAKLVKMEEDNLVQSEKDYFVIEDYKNPDSEHQLVLSTKKSLIFDKDDKPLYILGLMEDITNKIEVQSELKKSSLRFSKIFHSSPIPITVNKASDSTFIDFNQSFLDLVGYEYQELIGKNLVDLKIWLKESDRQSMFEEVLSIGTIRNREVEVMNKNGINRTMLLSMESFQFEDEYLIITMGLDISEIKNAATVLQKSLDRQQELNMLRTQFISMISHEFRTPLTTIMLSTDMLKRYGANLSDDDKLKHFNRIQETILRMTQLMENVLILGKMESGKFDLHFDKVDLNSYCESIASNIEFNTGGLYKIFYKYHSKENVTIIDENIFGLIITNLLTNAIKYSPKLSSVEFDVWLNEDNVVLSVRDYGIGIPEDDLRNLFNEFFRASNVGSTAGYGLGLSIVRKCIDSCNGKINIESKVNFGTTFTITIPRIFKI